MIKPSLFVSFVRTIEGAKLRAWASLAIAVSSMVLTSCSMKTFASSGIAISQPSFSIAREQTGQQLPIEARMQVGDRWIELEVARTPRQQALGLMYRENLEDDRGMLFPFDTPQPVRFWMKNVRISLDMIFLYEGEVVGIAAEAPPCNTLAQYCPTYSPGENILVDSVVELRGGRAAELGLTVGDVLDIEYLD